MGALLALASCSEPTAGTNVGIPRVNVRCTTSQCKTNANPWIFVTITTSSCNLAFIDQGAQASGTLDNVTCNTTSGCVGEVASWVGRTGGSLTTTIKSGSYSVCGRIDYNRGFPSDGGSNDTTATSDNVSIGANTASVTLDTQWQDP